MINWMQKRKNYLIPTIWISAIAFIGAGLVGWGSYDFNKARATSVAKIGKLTVSGAELNQRYSQLFNSYQEMSNGKFNKELAQEMGLDQIALNELMREALLLNLAKDLGIEVSDDEVVKFIAAQPAFTKNGKFDLDSYHYFLRMSGQKAKEFEASQAKAVALMKLYNAIMTPPTNEELELFNSVFFMQDRVEIKEIDIDANEISFGEDEIKKFWDEHKNNYLTTKSYEIAAYELEPQELNATKDELENFYSSNKNLYIDKTSDEILPFEKVKERVLEDFRLNASKSDALKLYLDLKNEKLTFNKEMKIYVDDKNFPIDELTNSKIGELKKPIIYNDKYLIFEVKKINGPMVKEFDSAKEQAKQDLQNTLLLQHLQATALKTLKEGFVGKDLGFVDVESSVDGLSSDESYHFLATVFNGDKMEGFVPLSNTKAIVYKITDQKLGNEEKFNKYKNEMIGKVSSVKDSELLGELLDSLQKRYPIERYYKGGKVE